MFEVDVRAVTPRGALHYRVLIIIQRNPEKPPFAGYRPENDIWLAQNALERHLHITLANDFFLR